MPAALVETASEVVIMLIMFASILLELVAISAIISETIAGVAPPPPPGVFAIATEFTLIASELVMMLIILA